MKNLISISIVVSAVVFCITCSTGSKDPQSNNSLKGVLLETRLQILEDREEIRQLLIDYGRTLDKRDFNGFSKLFTQDAEYFGGAGGDAIKGPDAIAKFLKDIFEQNPSGVKSPNFHLFANESIQVNGDEATASSKGIFVVPDGNDQPETVMLATYKDILVRENGMWKFKQRVVQSDIPSLLSPEQ